MKLVFMVACLLLVGCASSHEKDALQIKRQIAFDELAASAEAYNRLRVQAPVDTVALAEAKRVMLEKDAEFKRILEELHVIEKEEEEARKDTMEMVGKIFGGLVTLASIFGMGVKI